MSAHVLEPLWKLNAQIQYTSHCILHKGESRGMEVAWFKSQGLKRIKSETQKEKKKEKKEKPNEN